MHIAFITAGGAGMFCGSCMHDNTWARALRARGAEVTLIPTYTPIRVDEEDVSLHQVFFGGINVYLENRWRFWRKTPRLVRRWLDAPWLIDWATRLSVSNDARDLGPLTVGMLRGEEGPHTREIDELVDFVAGSLKPDVVCFSNALLVGTLRRLKQRFEGRVFCTLQGDDIFLQSLPEPHRSQAIELIRHRAQQFDGFLVHSHFYREFMSQYLGLPADKMHLLPLGIDFTGHDGLPVPRGNDRFTIGYFARICPEKGLHQLIDAFQRLHTKHPQTRLVIGGFLGGRDKDYFAKLRRELLGFDSAVKYVGSPHSHEEKVAFFRSIDVLSVPTVYREPKGIYVLEALANGVPVVQPRHGAFTELLAATGGGLLVAPENPNELAQALERLLVDSDARLKLAQSGYENVRSKYNAELMADQTLAILRS